MSGEVFRLRRDVTGETFRLMFPFFLSLLTGKKSANHAMHLVVVYSDLAGRVTPALLCSTLLRRSRWTCASAVFYHNLVC